MRKKTGEVPQWDLSLFHHPLQVTAPPSLLRFQLFRAVGNLQLVNQLVEPARQVVQACRGKPDSGLSAQREPTANAEHALPRDWLLQELGITVQGRRKDFSPPQAQEIELPDGSRVQAAIPRSPTLYVDDERANWRYESNSTLLMVQLTEGRGHVIVMSSFAPFSNRAIGRHGAHLIDHAHRRTGQTVQVLTHCNAGWIATVDFGTALSAIYQAHDAGIPVHVWVDETRPRSQGLLTAWELAAHGVPHTVIVDNAGGHLMQHGQVDLVLVGADRVSARGDVANKIGTYLKALAAHDNGVPFYAAVPSPTIDWSIDDGVAGIPIEERSADEVRQVAGLGADRLRTVVQVDASPAYLAMSQRQYAERGYRFALLEAVLKAVTRSPVRLAALQRL